MADRVALERGLAVKRWRERAEVAEARLRIAEEDLARSKDAHGRDVERAVRAEASVAHYENTITWFTTCHGCAAALDASYSETVRAEKAEAAAVEMLDLIRDLADPGPCEYDHHGYCQTHDGGADCPDARARELLAAFDAETCAHRAGEPGERA